MADTIDPIPLSDHMFPLTDTIVTSALMVAGRLDTELLRAAFATLVDKWPKLGARIVKGKKGVFECHTPSAFSVERSPFVYTVARHVDSQCPDIPKRTIGSHANMLTYRHLFQSKDCPASTSEWIKQKDAPPIRIHITTFSNVTCIGFTVPHIFTDVLGISVILRAWCSIIAGRETSKLPVLITEDPLAHIGGPYPSSKKELKAFHADMAGEYHLFSLWDKLRYYPPLIKEIVFHSEEVRLVFLPSKTLDKMRRSAMAELQDEKEVWVSENDIIYSLIIKLSNLHRDKNDETPYGIAMAANFRGLLPELKDPSKAFLHNCMTYVSCPVIPNGSVLDSSVGDLARHIRTAIVAQRPLAHSEKVMTVYREMCRRHDYPSYCPPNGRQYASTSWLAGGWSELNFSSAVIATDSIDAGSAEKPPRDAEEDLGNYHEQAA
ncbi:hypothetical protein FIBSPDRAFT_948270 [Athelia psychrophila]|uniref:CoA-dependent acyltransferase n=1 Tax=Athelia psychrophila TaxID=1759441 RepID=A0A166QXX2_9AGAM|nr:hypothetical protein FIBSPDRAFT_948270 [Fibularhizoctonia sp. CBS 109695]